MTLALEKSGWTAAAAMRRQLLIFLAAVLKYVLAGMQYQRACYAYSRKYLSLACPDAAHQIFLRRSEARIFDLENLDIYHHPIMAF